MFTDARSKRVIFTAHCILNQNAISDATADFPGMNAEVVRLLMDSGVGIVQMPCPELCCLGLDRGNVLGAESPVVVENTRIRREMRKPPASERLAALVDHVMLQIREYHRHGFEILAIIGSNRSPCCGVDTTSDNNAEIEGKGIFIEALCEALKKEGLEIPVIGIKASPEYIEKIKNTVGL